MLTQKNKRPTQGPFLESTLAPNGYRSGNRSRNNLRRGMAVEQACLLADAKSLLGGRYDHSKACWIVDRHVRKNLSIQLDVRLVQAIDQLAISQIVHSSGSIQTNDPEPTEVTSFAAAISVRKLASSIKRFLRCSVKPAATADVTLCSLE
jgi:hypothetical protein